MATLLTTSNAVTLVAGLLLWRLAQAWITKFSKNLDHIPTVGICSGPWPIGHLLWYLGVAQFTVKCRSLMEKGYEEYRNLGIFKVPTLDDWICLITNQEMIEELRKAPADVLSFYEAMNIELEVPFTLGKSITANPYHLPVVRNQLTKSLGLLLPELRDEIVPALQELIPVGSSNVDGWREVHVSKALARYICQTANRIFIGLPLCRNEDYIDLNVEHTNHVVQSAMILNLFPEFLKPVVSLMLMNVSRSIKREMIHLTPIIDQRRRLIAELGEDTTEKPNDLLMWLMDEATGDEKSQRLLSLRMLTLNFAAIHTTSMSLTHALYYLASDLELQSILRSEAEAVIAEEGWSKNSLSKLVKMDSFLKESQRVNGLGCYHMDRVALKPFTFSNGVHIPLGTHLAVATQSIHHDQSIYGSESNTFQPFRFVPSKETSSEDHEAQSARAPFVSTSSDYLVWGHGSAACPGRFFASFMLRVSLSEILLRYDLKMPNGKESVRPGNWNVGKFLIPDPKAKVMFRRREVEME